MHRIFTILPLIIFFKLLAHNLLAQQPVWVKVGITKTGVHTLSGNELRKAAKISGSQPMNVRVFGASAWPLSQKNSDSPFRQMQEVPIQLSNNAATLADNNLLHFYAESPQQLIHYQGSNLLYQRNPYADTLYYFIEVNGSLPYKKLAEVIDTSSKTPTQDITYSDALLVQDTDEMNLLDSGREWVSEFIPWKRTFDISLPNRVDTSSLWVTSRMVGTVLSPQALSVSVGGASILSHSFQPTGYQASHPYFRYNRRGEYDEQTARIKPAAGTAFQITYAFPQALGFPDGAFLDYFTVQYKQALALDGRHELIRLPPNPSGNREIIHLKKLAISLWNVSNPLSPNYLVAGYTIGTNVPLPQRTAPQQWVVFSEGLPAASLSLTTKPEIDFTSKPNLLIITPQAFRKAADKLASHREKQGIRTTVLLVETIQNAVSGGMPDPTAVRNVIREFWQRDASLQYVLLFGDATFDYRNKTKQQPAEAQNLVPTYQSRESLEPVYSYASDDYFGFLEPEEGDWAEGQRLNGFWNDATAQNHTLDVAIGRIPVHSLSQAQQVVDKLIAYDSPKTFGAWRQQVTLVADNEDYNLHNQDAEQLSRWVADALPWSHQNKIYVSNYPLVTTANGNRTPKASEALDKAVQEGSLLINYIGHGSEEGWSDEKLLTIDQLVRWRNLTNLPVFLTATCQFGRYDNPKRVSGGELALLNPRGGAAALLTTTRAVYSSSNTLVNKAFYENIGSGKRIGDIARLTKNNSHNGVQNRNFTLLGDPSMPFPYPEASVAVQSINGKAPAEAVLRPLEPQRITGTVSPNFPNGQVQFTLFDEPSTQKTLATAATPAFTFLQEGAVLYRGRAEVQSGRFTANLLLPILGTEAERPGKLVLYATDTTTAREGVGAVLPIRLGSAATASSDSEPPAVALDLLHTSLLKATVTDNIGLNIAPGQDWILSINDTLKVSVNQYIVLANDGKSAELIYPLPTHFAGTVTIQLKVWDVHNNSTTKALAFRIEPTRWQVISGSVWPNPTVADATFSVNHSDNAIQDYDLTLRLFSLDGRAVYEATDVCYYCSGQLAWELPLPVGRLPQGTYIYQLELKNSLTKQTIAHNGRLMVWK